MPRYVVFYRGKHTVVTAESDLLAATEGAEALEVKETSWVAVAPIGVMISFKIRMESSFRDTSKTEKRVQR